MDSTAHFYSAPTGFIPFTGNRRQTGGGIFGSIARALIPKLKDFGKAAARRALTTASNVVSDIEQGSSIGDALKSHGQKFLKDSLSDGVNRIAGQKRRSLVVTSSAAAPSLEKVKNQPKEKERERFILSKVRLLICY